MKKRLFKFASEAFPFMALSFILLFLAHMIGGKIEQEATAIFSENIAMRTISFLLVASIMMVSFMLLLVGHKTSEDGLLKVLIYEKFVDPILSFLTVFCAPSFGMILGFSFLLLLLGQLQYAFGSFLTSFIVLCYVILSELVRHIASNGYGEKVGIVKSKLASMFFFLVTPSLYIWLVEPISKCVS